MPCLGTGTASLSCVSCAALGGKGIPSGGVTSHPSLGWRGISSPATTISLFQQSFSPPPALPSPPLVEVASGHLKTIKRRLKYILCPVTVGFHAGKQGNLFRDCNISQERTPGVGLLKNL